MRTFIDQHRNAFGVEPLCKVLQVAPSAYRRHAALLRQPHKRCDRVKRDELLTPQIQRVWQANMQVYGADKVWRQLAREGVTVARCTVERLMRKLGLRGVMRGKVVRTTVGDAKYRSCWPQLDIAQTWPVQPTGATTMATVPQTASQTTGPATPSHTAAGPRSNTGCWAP